MLCLSEQILFTQRCEEAISGRSLQELLIELEAQLAGELHGWAAGESHPICCACCTRMWCSYCVPVCPSCIAAGYTRTDLKDLELSKEELHVLELKLKALIMDCIHFIDVVQQLLGASTVSTKEWQWQKQLRWECVCILCLRASVSCV